jgi:hypothetical protein
MKKQWFEQGRQAFAANGPGSVQNRDHPNGAANSGKE